MHRTDDPSDGRIVFVDDDTSGQVMGVKVLCFADLSPGDLFVLAVGSGETRQVLAEKCHAAGLVEHSVFAQSTIRGHQIEIGPGAVFCDNTIVTASARIGRQFQCNIYSYVAHDCVIGDYVTFAPRVSCNGNVQIGDRVYVGTGAVIRNGTPDKPLMIGEGAIIGMGAVVTRSVPAGVTVVGNPARAVA